MKADTLTVKALFQKEVHYVIPTFQRPYVWTQEKQWEPLWEDIRNLAERYGDQLVVAEGKQALAEEKTGSHFLGAVVLQQLPTASAEIETRTVIDGQQRLTTLQLFVDAAQQVFEERNAQVEAERVKRLVLNAYTTGDRGFKLWPTSLDQPAFRAAMTNDAPTAEFRTSLIVQAHDFFRFQIREWLAASLNDDARGRKIHGLETAIYGLIEMVVIDLGTGDDAHIIFETLNARGTPLRASDLVKNYVLQTATAIGHKASSGKRPTNWAALPRSGSLTPFTAPGSTRYPASPPTRSSSAAPTSSKTRPSDKPRLLASDPLRCRPRGERDVYCSFWQRSYRRPVVSEAAFRGRHHPAPLGPSSALTRGMPRSIPSSPSCPKAACRGERRHRTVGRCQHRQRLDRRR